MFLRTTTSVLAVVAFAAPALAEVTPSEVWQNWVEYYKANGYTVTEGGRDEAGETLEEEAAQPSTSKRERLDDHDYVEQSREIVDHVRGAVASAMRKKRRKGKERAA